MGPNSADLTQPRRQADMQGTGDRQALVFAARTCACWWLDLLWGMGLSGAMETVFYRPTGPLCLKVPGLHGGPLGMAVVVEGS